MLTEDFSFTVFAKPRGWKRARRSGNRYFVDRDEQEYRELILFAAVSAMRKAGWVTPPAHSPVRVDIVCRFPFPKRLSASRRSEASGTGGFTNKPDADNCAKAVLDSICGEGAVLRDDCQVSVLTVEKRYEDSSNPPSVFCRIRLI